MHVNANEYMNICLGELEQSAWHRTTVRTCMSQAEHNAEVNAMVL